MRLAVLLAICVLRLSAAEQRVARWHEDLEVLAKGMRASGIRIAGGIATRGQKDFAVLYPNFDAEVAAIEADIPKIGDDEVLLRLMKLMASAHVAHNLVQIPTGMGFAMRLPLGFGWLDDGLAVIAASSDYSGALGARVLDIGGRTPQQLLTALEPYISFENDFEKRTNFPDLIEAQGVLKHQGLVGPDRAVPITFQKPGGEPFTVPVAPALGNVRKFGLYEGLKIASPLRNTHPGSAYWHEYLADSGTLYIQYNQCENDPKYPFADFARQALADADAHAVQRVAIDLLYNAGGNSRVIAPLASGLAARLKSVGKVYVLVGPYTFSSAVDNAIQLQRDLKATLVGEPSGGMPKGYGEVALLKLPNSKLVVQITTKRWGPEHFEGPLSLTPAIPAPLRLADLLASRDPALDAVTSLP